MNANGRMPLNGPVKVLELSQTHLIPPLPWVLMSRGIRSCWRLHSVFVSSMLALVGASPVEQLGQLARSFET